MESKCAFLMSKKKNTLTNRNHSALAQRQAALSHHTHVSLVEINRPDSNILNKTPSPQFRGFSHTIDPPHPR